MNMNQTTENLFLTQQVLMAVVMHIWPSGRLTAHESLVPSSPAILQDPYDKSTGN